LIDHQFRIIHEEAVTEWENISAGAPQDSIIGLIFYLIYTTDTPNNDNTMTEMFSDDKNKCIDK